MFASSCLAGNVNALLRRGKLTKQKADAALSLLQGVLDYSEFKDVDLVIEVGCLKYFCFTGKIGDMFFNFGSFQKLSKVLFVLTFILQFNSSVSWH